MSATVVKGFGRGSKLLGIPTANMDMKEIGQKVNDTPTGIYLGYTMLEGVVYKAVVSIGWNPYFDNSEKTVEPHLLHKFDEDFYGEKLHLLLCGFIRNELNFNSLEDLIAAIGDDIRYAKRKFEEPEVASLAVDDPFWEDVAKGGSSILGDDDREGDNDDDGEGVTLGSYKKNNDSGSNGDV
ncbi:unnamed protein product, partial [Ascophyllum nodosum]